jgi:hypothetical protein
MMRPKKLAWTRRKFIESVTIVGSGAVWGATGAHGIPLARDPRPMNSEVSAPSVRRLGYSASTPENNNLVVDRTGATDSTATLNTWLQSLVTNGDNGELGRGLFKTSGALVASGGNSLRLTGNGPQSTVIMTTGSSYPGVHINLTGSFNPSGWIKGMSVIGPSPNPTGKQAGFLIDSTPLFKLDSLDVQNCDIGYDWNNDCFNAVGYNLNCSRFDSCNVGIHLRTGSATGSDMAFFNCQLYPKLFAICIAGGGGGYRFYGGELSAGNTVSVDANGVIQIGWDYINGVPFTGVDTTLFSGLSFEGWQGCHAIRVYGETQAKFDSLSFNASQASPGLQALDILKATGMLNSILVFDSCVVDGVYSNAQLGTISGSYAAGSTNIRQTNWYVPSSGYTVGGVGKGNPLTDITRIQ